MKLKNFKMNKKKLFSLLVAGGISLVSVGNSETLSYNTNTTLTDGSPAILYFVRDSGDYASAYISSGNMVGYVDINEVNMENINTNNYFVEENNTVSIKEDIAYVYQTPEASDTKVVGVLKKGDKVDIMAKTNDGWYAVFNNETNGFIHESSFIEAKNSNTTVVAKLTKNNINVRSSASVNDDNIIGFADMSDTFRILGKENGWYIVDYLGQTGYIKSDFIRETNIDEDDLEIARMAYLVEEAYFYTDLETSDGIYLPTYQNVGIIAEEGSYYKVNVDGIIGYINKNSVKKLTRTCVVVDLSRQLLRVYKYGNEVFRARIISGRERMQTHVGCFKIGHKVKGYQLTPENYVDYWIQYDENRGLHDASWQKDKYFGEVSSKAYDNYTSGRGKTYPYKHGSHGCNNMRLADVKEVYGLVDVGDNILVIGPNNLVRKHLISKCNFNIASLYNDETIKVKRLV